MSRTMKRVLTAVVATASLGAGMVAVSGPAAAAEEKIFVGYGYLPSDAYNNAVAQMEAYSPTCQEESVVYSPAGSEHYWKATLTALC